MHRYKNLLHGEVARLWYGYAPGGQRGQLSAIYPAPPGDVHKSRPLHFWMHPGKIQYLMIIPITTEKWFNSFLASCKIFEQFQMPLHQQFIFFFFHHLFKEKQCYQIFPQEHLKLILIWIWKILYMVCRLACQTPGSRLYLACSILTWQAAGCGSGMFVAGSNFPPFWKTTGNLTIFKLLIFMRHL